MARHLTQTVKERFEKVWEAKKHKDESVDAGRKYVQAYVDYMHHLEAVHKVITAESSSHHEEY